MPGPVLSKTSMGEGAAAGPATSLIFPKGSMADCKVLNFSTFLNSRLYTTFHFSFSPLTFKDTSRFPNRKEEVFSSIPKRSSKDL